MAGRTTEELEDYFGEFHLTNIGSTIKIRRSKRGGFTYLDYGKETNRKDELKGTVDNIMMDGDKKESILDKLEQLTLSEAETLYQLIKRNYMNSQSMVGFEEEYI